MACFGYKHLRNHVQTSHTTLGQREREREQLFVPLFPLPPLFLMETNGFLYRGISKPFKQNQLAGGPRRKNSFVRR